MTDGINEFKENYVSTWAKAARNCQRIHNDLRGWFPSLCFPLGHGAISSEWENGEHDKGEVDIFVMLGGRTIAGIEVTGSAKVDYPCNVWIGHHKIKYAKEQRFQVAYVLFYNNQIRFVDAKTVIEYAPDAKERRVFGNKEFYHVLDHWHTQPYRSLKEWLEKQRKKV